MTATTISIPVGSKPEAIKALRATWRASAEHKAAQIKRFLYAMGAVVIAQLGGDVAAHKDPLTHFTDLRTAWYFLIPFAFVAWRQVHPSMTASQADASPGVTIVPQQVGLPVDPQPVDPQPAAGAPSAPTSPIVDGVDTTPTGDGPPVVTEGDAAP